MERRTSRGGRDSIDHPPGSHDDLANVIAGAAVSIMAKPAYSLDPFQPDFVDTDADPDADPDPYGVKAAQQANYATYLLSGGQRRLF